MISEYIPGKTYAIVTGYLDNRLTGVVAGAVIYKNNTIDLTFPKNNPFKEGQKVTLHIDDRTGVETFTNDLNVYRCSYKSVLEQCTKEGALARPVEFNVIYKDRPIEAYKSSNYNFPQDNRSNKTLLETPLNNYIIPDNKESENKLGVWVTSAMERPHTTVMAFLSSENDDIFLISHRGSIKSDFIHRDNRSLFAIDHRSTYHFEKSYEWNYTIIRGETYVIPRSNPIFENIQRQFIEKNPWEILFFSNPDIEMFHIKPLEIVSPTH